MKVVRRAAKHAVPNQHKSQKGWRTISGKKYYFKSSWEAIFGWYLEGLKRNAVIKEWEYEPKIFWFEQIKRGCRSYTPDFRVIRLDGTHYWVEVKGYMDQKSRTKIKRFEKYYPEEKLRVCEKEWFDEQKKQAKRLVDAISEKTL
jgi:glucan-binding YG repeat protein